SLHFSDQFLDVASGRIYTWPQFNRAQIDHAETRSEVRPVLVIRDKFHSLERFGLLLPFSNLGVELSQISIPVARKVGLILGGRGNQRVKCSPSQPLLLPDR